MQSKDKTQNKIQVNTTVSWPAEMLTKKQVEKWFGLCAKMRLDRGVFVANVLKKYLERN